MPDWLPAAIARSLLIWDLPDTINTVGPSLAPPQHELLGCVAPGSLFKGGFILITDVMDTSFIHVPAWMTGCSFFVVRWCVRPVSPRHLRFSNSGLYTASLGISLFRKLTGSSFGSAPFSLFMGCVAS